MDSESVGAALFTAWFIAYVAEVGLDVYETPWDINDPFNTPHGLADPEGALAGLRAAAEPLELLRLLGIGIDVPYGDVFRLRLWRCRSPGQWWLRTIWRSSAP